MTMWMLIGAALAVDAEVAAGLALPTGELGPGPTVRLLVGQPLPWLEGRIRPHLGLGWSTGMSQGELSDPQHPKTLGWQVRMSQVQALAGLGLRGAADGAALSPELRLSGSWSRVGVRLDGDPPVGDALEVLWRPGLQAGLGIAAQVGPGDLLVELAGAWGPVGGQLAGGNYAAVGPSAGYRMPLGGT